MRPRWAWSESKRAEGDSEGTDDPQGTFEESASNLLGTLGKPMYGNFDRRRRRASRE